MSHTERSSRIFGYLHFLRSDPRIPVLHSSVSKAQTVFLRVSKHEFQTSALSAGLQISCSFLSSPACSPHIGDKKLIAVMQLKHSCMWKLFHLGLTDKMKPGTHQPDSPDPMKRGFMSTFSIHTFSNFFPKHFLPGDKRQSLFLYQTEAIPSSCTRGKRLSSNRLFGKVLCSLRRIWACYGLMPLEHSSSV